MEKIIALFMALKRHNQYSLTVNKGRYIIIKTECNTIEIVMYNGEINKIYLNNEKLSFDTYRAEELTKLLKW